MSTNPYAVLTSVPCDFCGVTVGVWCKTQRRYSRRGPGGWIQGGNRTQDIHQVRDVVRRAAQQAWDEGRAQGTHDLAVLIQQTLTAVDPMAIAEQEAS